MTDPARGAAPTIGQSVVAGEADRGLRLDRVLAAALPELSRSRLKALIEQGRVRLDGAAVSDPGRKVKPGERYAVEIPEPAAARPEGEPIALQVVYEDADLLVIDKPAGLVAHPAAGHWSGTLVNALIAHCGDGLSGIGGERRPGIVHRLDKDTSGLMVVAKSDRAHRGLAGQFAAHGADGRLQRAYLALVWGVLPRPAGRIEAEIGRKPGNRLKMAVVGEGRGRTAATRWETLARYAGAASGRKPMEPVASLVRCTLETGRTHQIRVHMAHAGHPLLGDATYGTGFAASASRLSREAQAALHRLGRQALHAARLGFEHPVTGKRMDFESDPPEDMARLITALCSGV